MINPTTDRVLITGAAGAIGTALRNGLRADWRHLRLTDNRPIADPTPNEECIVADVADRAAIERMMQGVAAVVHLTGVGGDYTLEDLFRVNARGMFDVFEAARLAGVQRIVYASSPTTRSAATRSRSASPLPCRRGPTACTARSRPGARPCCAATSIATASARCRCASAPTARCRSTSARSPPGCRPATWRVWSMRRCAIPIRAAWW